MKAVALIIFNLDSLKERKLNDLDKSKWSSNKKKKKVPFQKGITNEMNNPNASVNSK